MPRKGKPMMSPEYQRVWRKKNPTRIAAYAAKKRARVGPRVLPPGKTLEEVKAHDREWKRLWRLRNLNHDRRRRKAYTDAHKERYTLLRQQWKARNAERLQAGNLARRLRKYGISVDQYEQFGRIQNHRCAICGGSQPERKTRSGKVVSTLFCVDHDHKTGRVRGLLCTGCNLVLGNAKDKVEVLQAAVSYLEGHRWSVAV